MDIQRDDFQIVGAEYLPQPPTTRIKPRIRDRCKAFPLPSVLVLAVILLGCLFAEAIMTHDPTYMDLASINVPPNATFLFGTDFMGRDIFSMLWFGGRLSLFIGLLATLISTVIAVVYGSVSGVASQRTDDFLMRFAEIALSIPSILIVIFIQAIIGSANVLTISFIIGITGWMNIAKVVRSEVRQIRNSEYVLAAKCMNGNFLYIVRQHLLPNFVPAIMFMVVTNIATAIGTEATLSFLGIGLPLEIISWGSMLSGADRALLSNAWWVVLLPGLFLVVTMVGITDIGNYIRRKNSKQDSNF